MKILLIIPPYPIEEYPALSTGSMYLAAMLLGEGHSVEVLDLLISEASREKVERTVIRSSPAIVGVTSVTMTFPMAAEILGWVKDCRPDVITLMGGPHVTFDAERSLRECPAADIVVRGEAEITILELVHALASGGDLSPVPGITFRCGEEILSTGERHLVGDLDTLPFPAWDRLSLARYRALPAKVGVLSSRGCPYGCIFCVGHRMVGRKGRFRRPERVVDEMTWLADYGFSSIGIDDDLFTLDHEHAMAVCREIRSRRLPITWHAFARADTVTPDLLRAMREAGCTDICYGIESGSQEILDRIGKRITLTQARKAVQMGQDAGIQILASFILGLPGETRETLKQTDAFARSLGCRFGFHVLAPFPGTRVRAEAEQFGIRILTDRWDLYDANQPVCLTPEIASEDIQAILDRYDGDIHTICNHQAARVRSGEAHPEEQQEVLLREQRAFAWEVLRGDLIEKHGRLRGTLPKEEAVPVLAQKMRQHLPFPLDRIQDTLRGWVKERLLHCEADAEGWRWRWATNEELLDRDKTSSEGVL